MPLVRVFYRINIACALAVGIFMVVLPSHPNLYQHSSSNLMIQEIALWSVVATHMTGAISGWHTHRRYYHKKKKQTDKRQILPMQEFRVLL